MNQTNDSTIMTQEMIDEKRSLMQGSIQERDRLEDELDRADTNVETRTNDLYQSMEQFYLQQYGITIDGKTYLSPTDNFFHWMSNQELSWYDRYAHLLPEYDYKIVDIYTDGDLEVECRHPVPGKAWVDNVKMPLYLIVEMKKAYDNRPVE